MEGLITCAWAQIESDGKKRMKQKIDVILPIVVLVLIVASMIYPQPWLMILSTAALSGYLLYDWYQTRNKWMLIAALAFVGMLVLRLWLN